MKLTVVVMIVDGTPDKEGYIHPPGSVEIDEKNEVPVTLDFRRDDLAAYLGRAMLHWHGQFLVADLDLLDSRMGATADGKSMLDVLYPAVGGVGLDVDGKTIKKYHIREVGLCVSKNLDVRILSLGTQLNLTRN